MQKFWKSLTGKIWQSYREFKGGNYFWDTVSRGKKLGKLVKILWSYCYELMASFISEHSRGVKFVLFQNRTSFLKFEFYSNFV